MQQINLGSDSTHNQMYRLYFNKHIEENQWCQTNHFKYVQSAILCNVWLSNWESIARPAWYLRDPKQAWNATLTLSWRSDWEFVEFVESFTALSC